MAQKNYGEKIKESSASVEIGGYVHQDAGKARVKLYVGDVNKPLKIDDAALTKRMKKLKVTMNVSEDTSVENNKVYEKLVDMKQYDQDSDSPTNDMTNDNVSSSPPDLEIYNTKPKTNDNPLTAAEYWAKNMIDVLRKDVRWLTAGLVIGLVIAIAAVTGLYGYLFL